ncbi:MAG TPA: hypothetical protein DCL29_05320 [Eubacterium sp.]|nr:hypothetical protein [Eubacterium sp.]HAV91204.1 hypothetical protein [Eubacterium sp.]
MYRYETHLHTVESSLCGVTPGSEYPRIYKERGYDGIFITDHFYGGNTRPSRDLPWDKYVDEFMKGYEEAKKVGDEIGLKVFFGLEENFEADEYLIYGIDREFLLSHPGIRNWTREQMLEWVHEAGGAIIQAHPFRDREYINPIHLFKDGCDGIELINTSNTPNDNKAAFVYGKKFDFYVQAGSDTHDKNKIGDYNAGIIFDKPIESTKDYAKRILADERPKLFYPESIIENVNDFEVKTPVEIYEAGKWKSVDVSEVYNWV